MPPPMTMRGAMWASLPTALRDKSRFVFGEAEASPGFFSETVANRP